MHLAKKDFKRMKRIIFIIVVVILAVAFIINDNNIINRQLTAQYKQHDTANGTNTKEKQDNLIELIRKIVVSEWTKG